MFHSLPEMLIISRGTLTTEPPDCLLFFILKNLLDCVSLEFTGKTV